MNKFVNLARVNTATIGTGTVTLGSTVSGFLSFADAGLIDGDIISYAIKEGATSEVGIGTYNTAGPTVTRSTILKSTSANNALNLGGNAQIAVTASAEDFDFALNTQTGTAYTILQTDRKKLVTFSNASAIAVTLPQATGFFKVGWSTTLKNVGNGKVTITPTTSTIGGATSLTLEKGQAVKLLSDGTNYHVIKQGSAGFYAQTTAPTPAEVGDKWLDTDTGIVYTYVSDGDSFQWADLHGGAAAGDLISANNLSDVANVTTARTNLVAAHALAGADQYRLDYVSTTSIQLNRHKGKYIFINGAVLEVPETGPTLANTGLTASTLYYIYAYSNSGTLTLEASTTAPANDSTYGHKIKTGDASRTLVGMVYMNTGTPGVFADTDTKRWVLSYRNRVDKAVQVTSGTGYTSTSAPWAEINSVLRAEFLHWGDETILCGTKSLAFHATANIAMYLRLAFGVAVGTYATGNAAALFGVSAAANYYTNIGALGPYSPVTGFNTVTLQGGRDSGTANYSSGYTGYAFVIKG